jgi:hypothetical protein
MTRRGGVSRALTPLAVAVLATVGVVACGVPSGGEFLQIEEGQIPYGLAETTTTTRPPTTTSTTRPPMTTSTTVVETTTTLALEDVRLYFLTGLQLVPIQRSLAAPATPSQVLAALVEGPPTGESGVGLRTALPVTNDIVVTVERGVATVDLPAGYVDEIAASEQRRAIAQIVLTLSVLPRASFVVFLEAGEPLAIPRGRGDLSAPGEPVTFEDYEPLLTPGRVP